MSDKIFVSNQVLFIANTLYNLFRLFLLSLIIFYHYSLARNVFINLDVFYLLCLVFNYIYTRYNDMDEDVEFEKVDENDRLFITLQFVIVEFTMLMVLGLAEEWATYYIHVVCISVPIFKGTHKIWRKYVK